MPWIDPTRPDLQAALATALASPAARSVNRIDVGMWAAGAETLLLVANVNEHDAELALPLSDALDLPEMLNYGARRIAGVERQLKFEQEGLGCAIFVAHPSPLVVNQRGHEL
ncbi:hypothetical protein B0H13DRAFT_2363396 [Mycena leptocephala]|nr:hypothetical protein B0H13DRAFT_2363396 [Mycena leptocephala]